MYTVFFASPYQIWSLRNVETREDVIEKFTDLRMEQTAQSTSSIAVILMGDRFIAACEDLPSSFAHRFVHHQALYDALTPDLRYCYRAIFNRAEFLNVH